MSSARTVAIAAVVALSCATFQPVSALPIPASPHDPAVASLWNNPAIRTTDQTNKVTAMSERIEGDEITLNITNGTLEPLHHLSVRIQRAEPIKNVAEALTALAADQSAYSVATPFENVDISLNSEQSQTVTIRIDREKLRMDKPGIYPLLINLNGQIGQQEDAYLTSERFLYQPEELDKKDTPMSLLLPVTADTDLVPGETGEAPSAPKLLLATDSLASQLSPSGRLTGLLDAYQHADRTGTCLAIDPELVDVVDRMRAGYRVTNSRPNPVAPRPRLRDSWFTDTQKDPGVPGSGAAAAEQWIAKLRRIDAEGGCITPLPWANADLNAVGRTGNQALMNEAVSRGNLVLSRVLSRPIRSDMVIAGQGYVDKRAATALSETSRLDPELEWEANPDAQSWRVLVAENTVGTLPPNVSAVTFDPALGTVLAGIGDTPDTVGYGNQWQRLDPRVDSPVARRVSAASALALAATESAHVIALPPSDISAVDARALIDATNGLYSTGRARPARFYDAPNAPGKTDALGSPYDNPSEVTDTEVLRATQQAKSLDDLTALMTNDPTIALTRYNYINPLRLDLLRALSVSGRRSIASYDTATRRADSILNGNRDTQQNLRRSVALLPPGNVYTRTSSSSPLLIVAQNGLPLPVDARLGYSGPEGASINVPPSLRIPARGSITAQMTADLPNSSKRTDLTVWLAAQSGAQISVPVEIGVQTRSGLLGISTVVAGLFALVGMLIFRQARRRRS
ncbi:hypothetical protein QVA66_09695 [Staphylococcus chromogenes]|nr:hypothetical protein [Staphylococcus chromogenes]